MNFKETLFLPVTEFPMKAQLHKLEPLIQDYWKTKEIYQKLLRLNINNKAKIIFDGPPYANGSIHLGTALNKILKDIYVRFFFQKQYYSEFIYGWDMFGLPIENAILKHMRQNDRIINCEKQAEKAEKIIWFRKACQSYSNSCLLTQANEFSSLGLLVPPENHYKTSDSRYVSELLDIYENLRQERVINRSSYPTWWSIKKQTSIAEADVTYKKIRVQDALFRYSVKNINVFLNINSPIWFLVWTSSVWTIPGNFFLAINKRMKYCIAEIHEHLYIVAVSRITYLEQKLDIKKIKIFRELPNNKILLLLNYYDPFRDTTNHVFFADHVTDSFGTGVVHISPAHGRDDYLLAKKYKIKYRSVMNAKGYLINTSFYDNMLFNKAVPMILERLKIFNMFVASHWICHDYPFYKSLGEPLFTIPTKQYFLSFKQRLDKIKQLISQIKFYPKGMGDKLWLTLLSRFEWCISRQRFWGVPIPEIFLWKNIKKYPSFDLTSTTNISTRGKKKKERKAWLPFSDAFLHNVRTTLQSKGAEVWFEEKLELFFSPEQRLAIKNKELKISFEKSVFDVWFDSSCALHIIKNRFHRPNIDIEDFVLIEGVDQHRGWFNSSIIMLNALGYQKGPQEIITHGFVVDSHNIKMSKSLGNVTNPDEFVAEYGAEILRLFFANNKFIHNIIVNQKNIDFAVANYRKIRNVMRWLLGLCQNYQFSVSFLQMVLHKKVIRMFAHVYHGYDYIILKKLTELVSDYHEDMTQYKLWRACRKFEMFITNDLSARYAVHAKDIFYIRSRDDKECQKMMEIVVIIAIVLIKLMASIIPHTCEEWFHYFSKEVLAKQKSVVAAPSSIFLCPITTKVEFNACANRLLLDSFYSRVVSLIYVLVKRAQDRINRDNQHRKKFNKMENIIFWFIPQSQYQNHLSAKLIESFFPFAQVIHIRHYSDIPTNTEFIYSVIIDPPTREKIANFFSYVAFSFFNGEKCQRCWKFFSEEQFNSTRLICNKCNVIVNKAETK